MMTILRAKQLSKNLSSQFFLYFRTCDSFAYIENFSICAKESISKFCLIRPNVDCNYTYPSDFTPNEISVGAISLGQV